MKFLVKNVLKIHSFISKRGLSNSIKRHQITQTKFDCKFYENVNCKLWVFKLVSRNFQTSKPRSSLAEFLIVVRPLIKFIAFFGGRGVKWWWNRLSIEERERFLDGVRRNTTTIGGFWAFFVGIIGVFYITHLEQDPVSGRFRLMLFPEDMINQLADAQLEMVVRAYRSSLLPTSDTRYQNVVRIIKKILESNRDVSKIKDKRWYVFVIDEPRERNAFVLANGSIFIYTGIMRVCSNDDQLGLVISHEISHAILSHTAEALSNAYFFEFLSLIPLLFVWAILPDMMALTAHVIIANIASIFIQLPLSRRLELEADKIGLILGARSCFDVREFALFWDKMDSDKQPSSFENQVPPWLSTHPDNESRKKYLETILPTALKVRSDRNCPELPHDRHHGHHHYHQHQDDKSPAKV